MRKVTFDEIANAARRLVESGDQPSAPKIRKLLGDRGGMATIQKHLEKWREAEAEKGADSPQLPEMPEQLANDAQLLIKQIWGQAKTVTDGEIQGEREALAQERTELLEKLAEAVAVSEQQESQIDELKDTTGELKGNLEQQEKIIEENKVRLTELNTEVAVLSERCNQYQTNLKAAEEREKKLLAQLDKLSDNIGVSKK